MMKPDPNGIRHTIYSLCISMIFLACDTGTDIVNSVDDDDAQCFDNDDCDVDEICEGGICVENICVDDANCPNGFVCVQGQCLAQAEYDCRAGQVPRFHIETDIIDFGNIAQLEEAEMILEIENLGACNLVIDDIGFSGETSPIFSCPSCDPAFLPLSIAPRRTASIHLIALTDRVGQYSGELLIKTNDFSVKEDGLYRVPITAQHLGVPQIAIDPLILNFQYVAPGDSRSLQLSIGNIGTGEQPLYVRLRTAFEHITIDESRLDLDENGFFRIAPGANDVEIPVQFVAPQAGSTQDFSSFIQVDVHEGDVADIAQLSIPLTATTNRPPDMAFQQSLGLFCEASPCIVGDPNAEILTLAFKNEGDRPFYFDNIEILSDFAEAHHFEILDMFSTGFIAPSDPQNQIPGGEQLNITMQYLPTTPSDSGDPNLENWPNQRGTPHEAFLRVTSFSQGRFYELPLKGYARLSQVDTGFTVSMRMTIDRGDRDLRDADLQLLTDVFDATIEGGYRGPHFCQKPQLLTQENSDGEYVVIGSTDVCERDWSLGQARWSSPSSGQNPEKITVSDLPTDDALNTEFVVATDYAVSCVRPNAFWGNLVAVLFVVGNVALAVTTGVVIPVNPADIARTINESCGQGEDLQVEIEIHENGQLRKRLNTILPRERTGQHIELYRFRREDGALVFD